MSESDGTTGDAGEHESERPERGRDAVERRLTEATADLLAEVGPEQLSIRTVSKKAQVNSGQVYHYFGSKDALLQAGMRRLAENHFEHMRGRHHAIRLLADERYWRALGHTVLDGADDLFRLEIEAGISMPLGYIRNEAANAGGTLDAEQAARALANVALTLGWATFEPFLLALINEVPDPPSRDDLRQAIAKLLDEQMESWADPPENGS